MRECDDPEDGPTQSTIQMTVWRKKNAETMLLSSQKTDPVAAHTIQLWLDKLHSQTTVSIAQARYKLGRVNKRG